MSALSPSERERYARHIMLKELGGPGQQRLKAATVAIVGVGGFLGMGEKDVAIPFADITVTRDENNLMRLTIAATKEQLEAAPAFDRTAFK